jgi:hypothetical protein
MLAFTFLLVLCVDYDALFTDYVIYDSLVEPVLETTGQKVDKEA